MRYRKWAAALCALALCLWGCSSDTSPKEGPFRLHVIAHSNAREDQQVKLAVRDGILALTAEAGWNWQNSEEARAYVEDHLKEVEQRAARVLAEEGFSYGAKAQVGVYTFPDKVYGTTLYPAGKYQALRVVLGDGQGENWWCVIFPPLCLPPMEEDTQVRSFLLDLFRGRTEG